MHCHNVVNPRCACTARVTVLGLSVCLSVFQLQFILALQATRRPINRKQYQWLQSYIPVPNQGNMNSQTVAGKRVYIDLKRNVAAVHKGYNYNTVLPSEASSLIFRTCFCAYYRITHNTSRH